MTLSMKSTIGELDTVLPAAYIDTKGYNNTIMIAERGSIQFFFRYIAKDRRGNKETNNYQSYRTKKDTLSFIIYLFFPLFCDLTTRYHFSMCSFLRRHVISAQTKPREYLTGNDQSQRTYYSVYFIQFIISLFYIFICFNNFVFMVFLIYIFIYIFYLSRRIM